MQYVTSVCVTGSGIQCLTWEREASFVDIVQQLTFILSVSTLYTSYNPATCYLKQNTQHSV